MSGNRQYYEKMYQDSQEPWNYKNRGAEILRHESIAELLRQVRPQFQRALDIGCSLGQLTEKVAPLAQETVAFDVSTVAVEKAQSRVGSPRVHFLACSLPGLPFQPEGFDLILAVDAIHEFVPEPQRPTALTEIFRCLKKDGYALFSDYMKLEQFYRFLELIQQNNFKIVNIVPLHDRCWYQFESWFKGVRHWGGIKKLLASVALARALRWPARLFGLNGCRHILILTQKQEEH